MLKKLPNRIELTASLQAVLENRRTNRSCQSTELADDMLATLLWACAGISSEDGKRTAPSARDLRAVSAYVLRADGVWRYAAEGNAIEKITDRDVRVESTTHQSQWVGSAPVSIIFVADHAIAPELPSTTLSVDAGTMAENAYLACTGLGLAGCIRASLNHESLKKAMKLPETSEPILAFTVGYPL